MSRLFRRRFGVAIVLSALAIAALPALALAGTQGAACRDSSDSSKVRLWENSIGDTEDNNDTNWLCSSDTDLSNNDHTLPGNCNAVLFDSLTWNDCVSSVTVYLPAGECIDFFRNADGTGNMNNTVQGPASGVRFNLPYNDSLSRFTIYSC